MNKFINNNYFIFIIIIIIIFLVFYYTKNLNEKFDNNQLIIEQNNNSQYTTIIQNQDNLNKIYYLNNEQKQIYILFNENLNNKEIDLLLSIKLLNNNNIPKPNCNYLYQYLDNIFTNITLRPPNGYMILLDDKYSAKQNDILWINSSLNQNNVFFGNRNENMILNIHHNQNIMLSIKLKKV